MELDPSELNDFFLGGIIPDPGPANFSSGIVGLTSIAGGFDDAIIDPAMVNPGVDYPDYGPDPSLAPFFDFDNLTTATFGTTTSASSSSLPTSPMNPFIAMTHDKLKCGHFTVVAKKLHFTGDVAETCRFWTEGVISSVIAAFGLMGNVVSIWVLSVPEMRNSFNRLLLTLAIIDCLFILPGILIYTSKAFAWKAEWYNYAFPVFLYPFSEMALCSSIYMTVAIAVERYIGLCRPLQRLSRRPCSARFYIIPVIIIALLLNVTKFLESETVVVRTDMFTNETTSRVRVTELRTHPTYITYYWMWTRLLATGIVPLVVLAILNSKIYLSIRQSKQQLRILAIRSALPMAILSKNAPSVPMSDLAKSGGGGGKGSAGPSSPANTPEPSQYSPSHAGGAVGGAPKTGLSVVRSTLTQESSLRSLEEVEEEDLSSSEQAPLSGNLTATAKGTKRVNGPSSCAAGEEGEPTSLVEKRALLLKNFVHQMPNGNGVQESLVDEKSALAQRASPRRSIGRFVNGQFRQMQRSVSAFASGEPYSSSNFRRTLRQQRANWPGMLRSNSTATAAAEPGAMTVNAAEFEAQLSANGAAMVGQAPANNTSSSNNNDMKLAPILFGVVIVFILCNSLRVILNIYDFSVVDSIILCEKKGVGRLPPAWILCSISVSHLLLMVNSSVNFLVYCVAGTRFRRVLVRKVKAIWGKVRRWLGAKSKESQFNSGLNGRANGLPGGHGALPPLSPLHGRGMGRSGFDPLTHNRRRNTTSTLLSSTSTFNVVGSGGTAIGSGSSPFRSGGHAFAPALSNGKPGSRFEGLHGPSADPLRVENEFREEEEDEYEGEEEEEVEVTPFTQSMLDKVTVSRGKFSSATTSPSPKAKETTI